MLSSQGSAWRALPRSWRASSRSSSRLRGAGRGNQAGGAVGQALRGRGPRRPASPSAPLHRLQHALVGLDEFASPGGASLALSNGTRLEIDVALAHASDFQRLTIPVARHHGPGRRRSGRSAAAPRCFAPAPPRLGVGLQPLEAFADQVVDLGLVGLEVGDVLLAASARSSDALLAKRQRPSSWARRSWSSVQAFLQDWGPKASQIVLYLSARPCPPCSPARPARGR